MGLKPAEVLIPIYRYIRATTQILLIKVLFIQIFLGDDFERVSRETELQ